MWGGEPLYVPAVTLFYIYKKNTLAFFINKLNKVICGEIRFTMHCARAHSGVNGEVVSKSIRF